MLDSTLTPDRAMTKLLLKYRSLYKWITYYRMCVSQCRAYGVFIVSQRRFPSLVTTFTRRRMARRPPRCQPTIYFDQTELWSQCTLYRLLACVHAKVQLSWCQSGASRQGWGWPTTSLIHLVGAWSYVASQFCGHLWWHVHWWMSPLGSFQSPELCSKSLKSNRH
jgi:hypothetical protein